MSASARVIVLTICLHLAACTLLLEQKAETEDDADVVTEVDADESFDADVDRDGDRDDGGQLDAEADLDRDEDVEADADADVDEDVTTCPDIPPSTATELVAVETSGVTIDGNLSDWDGVAFYEMSGTTGFVCTLDPCVRPYGDDDLSFGVAAQWTSESLFLAFRVIDEFHINIEQPDVLFENDSVQYAFDMALDREPYPDFDDDVEDGLAQHTDGRLMRWRWQPWSDIPYTYSGGAAIQRVGVETTYEVELPRADLHDWGAFATGQRFGFTFLVNESDSGVREGYVEWSPGIGNGKDPSSYGTLLLFGVPPECR